MERTSRKGLGQCERSLSAKDKSLSSCILKSVIERRAYYRIFGYFSVRSEYTRVDVETRGRRSRLRENHFFFQSELGE